MLCVSKHSQQPRLDFGVFAAFLRSFGALMLPTHVQLTQKKKLHSRKVAH